MFARVTWTLFVSVLLWKQTMGEGFTPIEWSPRIYSGNCEAHSDPNLTSVLASLSEMLSNSSHSSSLPESCLEIKNSFPYSPSGYYTLFNATNGVASITYCDMDDLPFNASAILSELHQLRFNSPDQKGEKGDTGLIGSAGAKGQKGAKGDTGMTGPAGRFGSSGMQGPRGDKGAKGQKGDTGGN